MLPRWNSYGDWPASGEIDLVETRANLDLTGKLQNIAKGSSSSLNSNFLLWQTRVETRLATHTVVPLCTGVPSSQPTNTSAARGRSMTQHSPPTSTCTRVSGRILPSRENTKPISPWYITSICDYCEYFKPVCGRQRHLHRTSSFLLVGRGRTRN